MKIERQGWKVAKTMAKPSPGALAEKLKGLREGRDLSQQDLAQRAGMSWSVVAHIEQGRTTNPRIDTLKAIARALGVPVQELIEE